MSRLQKPRSPPAGHLMQTSRAGWNEPKITRTKAEAQGRCEAQPVSPTERVGTTGNPTGHKSGRARFIRHCCSDAAARVGKQDCRPSSLQAQSDACLEELVEILHCNIPLRQFFAVLAYAFTWRN